MASRLHVERANRLRSAPLGRRLKWSLEWAVIGLFWWVCGRLSPDAAARLGDALLRRIGPRLRKNEHVPHNLALACPAASGAGLARLVAAAWGDLGAAIAEYPHLERICVKEVAERIEFRGIEALRGRLASGRPAVLVAAHLANWEIPAAAARAIGLPLAILHTPQKNPWIARRLERFRGPLGCEYLAKDRGLRDLIRMLERGRSIAILADIRVDNGVPLPMFETQVPTTLIPARLALRYRCDLIPVRVERLTGSHFRVSVAEPVRPDEPCADERRQALQMMTKLNGLFADWIRARPTQWACVKRRDSKPNPQGLGRTPVAPGDPIPEGLVIS